MPKPTKHILVIRLSSMGDVAMTVPVLRAFTETYPDVKLTVLTRDFFIPFFRDLQNVRVYTPDLEEKHKGIFGLFELSRELKDLGIDAVADLHNVLRTKILKLFLYEFRVVQIDKGRAEKKDLISGNKFSQLKTTHQRYADVFSQLGYPLELTNPRFQERAELNSKTQSIVGENRAYKWIGIAPFAAHIGKMYPLELMEQVIGELSKSNKIILFGGGQEEIKKLNVLEHQFKNVVNVSGMLSLDEELDLISNLDLMLSMDSANGHLAAMMGIKVLTLWGVTHPFAGFSPFNQPEDFYLITNRNIYPLIPTSIYGNNCPESYRDCMKSITPQTIVDKIEAIL